MTFSPTVVPEAALTIPTGTRKTSASKMARTRHQMGVCEDKSLIVSLWVKCEVGRVTSVPAEEQTERAKPTLQS